MRAVAALLLTGVLGCGVPAGSRDGGGGDLASGGGGDLGYACTMPGACSASGRAGVCCVRAIGPRDTLFCDTTDSCPLQHGVDTFQSPLCATNQDCQSAARVDLGAVYCCPTPNLPVKSCSFAGCPVP